MLLRRDANMVVAAARCLCVAAALAGAASGPAFAQDAGFHPIDRVLKALDMKTDVGPAPGFVEETHPKSDDFLSVGQQHPTRPIKVKTHDELKAMEAELDAARERHDKITGRNPTPGKPAKKSEVDAATLRATQN